MRKLLLLVCLLLPSLAHALPEVQVVRGTPHAWLIEDRTLPVVQLSLRFEGKGTASDPANKQGLASMAADMLQEGSGKMNSAEWQAYLNAHALSISVSVQRDDLIVSLYCLREHLPEGFRALQMMLTQPRLSPEALERVRAEHIASLRMRMQSPAFYSSRDMDKLLYPDHPYGQAGSGTMGTLALITLADVQGYLAHAFDAKHLQISAAGAVRADVLKALINETMEALPESDTSSAKLAHIPPIEASQTIGVLFENAQTDIQFAMPGVARDSKDFYTAYVLTHILGGSGLTSYLPQKIRQERGLTYGVFTWLDPSEYGAYLRGSFATATATRDEALQVLNDALDEAYTNGFTQEQRDDAVSYLTGSFPLNLDSTSSLARYLRLMQEEELGTNYLKERNAFFEAVTLEDVNRVAKQLLNPKQRIIVWAGKEMPRE